MDSGSGELELRVQKLLVASGSYPGFLQKWAGDCVYQCIVYDTHAYFDT